MAATYLQPYRDSRHRHYRRHNALDALSDAGAWLLATLRAWRRRSRERAELAGLDNRMLKDIGLTRGDAEFLANKPFWKE